MTRIMKKKRMADLTSPGCGHHKKKALKSQSQIYKGEFMDHGLWSQYLSN